MISLSIRLEEFPEAAPHLVGTDGTPSECMAWLKGFLGAGGVIVDNMKVMGK